MQELTQEYIRSLFDYEGGYLYWNFTNQGHKKGNIAGSLDSNGYYYIKINYKKYLAHRLIYLYHKGYLPKFIDHIDRNKENNRIENLREATLTQNQWNRPSQKNSSSKYKGISWHKNRNKWIASIRINKKLKYLGSFDSETDAAKAYNKAASKYHGEYGNLNDPKL